MSRVIAYRRFIEVRFEDDAGQPVSAFEPRALPQTRATLSRHRLLARPQADGLALYYRINPQAVPALLGAISERIRMSFAVHAITGGFFERHLPDLSAASGAGLQFDNLDAGGAIKADGAALSDAAAVGAIDAAAFGPRLFPVHLDLTASSPTAVEARADTSGALAASANVMAPAGATAAQVALDLSAASGVVFRLSEVPPGAVERRAYADDTLSDLGAIGVIDLYWETAQTSVPDPDGVVYHVVFTRR